MACSSNRTLETVLKRAQVCLDYVRTTRTGELPAPFPATADPMAAGGQIRSYAANTGGGLSFGFLSSAKIRCP